MKNKKQPMPAWLMVDPHSERNCGFFLASRKDRASMKADTLYVAAAALRRFVPELCLECFSRGFEPDNYGCDFCKGLT